MLNLLEKDEGYFKADGFHGVALRVVGYPKTWVPITTLLTDESGWEHEVETGEGEWEEDREGDKVLVRMVGDDQTFTVDRDALTKIEDDDFCDGCGQIGCGHSSRREA